MNRAMNRDELIAELIRDEGLRRKPYRDTVGKLTIGIGRNLDDVGLDVDEIHVLANNDIDRRVVPELDRHAAWWAGMSERRQRALANMCFNMGWPTLRRFRRMLAALEAGDYERAAAEAKDSKWYRQVGARADRIIDMIAEG